jgi:hypothetical protein
MRWAICCSIGYFQGGRRKNRPLARAEGDTNGINHIAVIGAPVEHIHAATNAPGQLKIRYVNGVRYTGRVNWRSSTAIPRSTGCLSNSQANQSGEVVQNPCTMRI